MRGLVCATVEALLSFSNRKHTFECTITHAEWESLFFEATCYTPYTLMDNPNLLTNKPVLKKIYDVYGNLSLSAYETLCCNRAKEFASTYPIAERQKELFDGLHLLIEKILGKECADRTITDLQKNPITSTADHHGILSHPYFLSSNAIRLWNATDRGHTTLLTLPCAGVSLSNHSFPRGFMVHTKKNQVEKIYLKSLKEKLVPVYVADPLPSTITQNLTQQIQNLILSHTEKEKLNQTITTVFNDAPLLSLPSFDLQITKATHTLAKELFGHDIDLVYLSQETLAVELLLTHHMHEETLIHSLIFDPKITKQFEKHFDGIPGAFSETHGSFLFWGIRDQKRIQLFYENNQLCSKDTSFELELNPKQVEEMLLNKKIMPTMALNFIVISFYYGLVCGGGFNQVQYLADMKKAWIEVIKNKADQREIERLTALPTDIYLGDYAFMRLPDKSGFAHAFDSILHISPKELMEYKKIPQTKTLAEDIDDMIQHFQIVS